METILEYSGVTKNYGAHTALDNVNLGVPAGKITGLLGPNGSGKTTLIKLAAGLLVPNSGAVAIGGVAPGAATKACVSYLPDRDYLNDWMRVEQLVKYFCDFFADFSRTKAEDMLSRLGIDPKMKLKALSKGNKEKVQLILTMARQAKLYILDEPIGGVDPAARDYILETIIANRPAESAVLVSTHLIADVEPVLDHAVFIKNGRILRSDGAEEIRRQSGKSLDELFREEFRC